jgi:hypothetical protein
MTRIVGGFPECLSVSVPSDPNNVRAVLATQKSEGREARTPLEAGRVTLKSRPGRQSRIDAMDDTALSPFSSTPQKFSERET